MTYSATKLVALVCFSLFLSALCARSVHAQAIHEGKLTGTVTQEDGAVLPGATVDISGPQLLGGKRSVVTSARRHVLVPQCAEGRLRRHDRAGRLQDDRAGQRRGVRRCHVHCRCGACRWERSARRSRSPLRRRSSTRRRPPPTRGSTTRCSKSFRRAGTRSTTCRSRSRGCSARPLPRIPRAPPRTAAPPTRTSS